MGEPPITRGGEGDEPVPRPGGRGGGHGSRGSGFGSGGVWDTAVPSPVLATALAGVAGPGRVYAGLSDDELVGVMGRWQAMESWGAAGKLSAVRALLRRRRLPGYGTRPGGLPQAWDATAIEEVALQLSVSRRAADQLVHLAWSLEARLPLTARALDEGVLDLAKVRIIVEATDVLDDGQAAEAEKILAEQWSGLTPGQLGGAAGRAVVRIDPEGARKRREREQREKGRVEFWREHAGTSAIAAYGLPPDEALIAQISVQERAVAYKKAGVKGRMDILRVRAFLDLLSGRDARTSQATPDGECRPGGEGRPDGDVPEGWPSAPSPEYDDLHPDDEDPGSGDDPSPGDGPDGGDGPGDGGPGGGDGGPGGGAGPDGDAGPGDDLPASDGPLPANVNLTIPLATLLGLGEVPGEAPGLGVIDPALARDLAARAAASGRSRWHVTVTDEHGHAIGHGCARPPRTKAEKQSSQANGARDGPRITRSGSRGPPGGHGTWTLSPAGGDEQGLIVKIHGIPAKDCDHRYQGNGHDPSDLLRHLVEIRDGVCTFPPCLRAAAACDFEHTQPYERGGRTCSCNCAHRCRRDHKLKQKPGWTVSRPKPDGHHWRTPSGRTYISKPVTYPI